MPNPDRVSNEFLSRSVLFLGRSCTESIEEFFQAHLVSLREQHL